MLLFLLCPASRPYQVNYAQIGCNFINHVSTKILLDPLQNVTGLALIVFHKNFYKYVIIVLCLHHLIKLNQLLFTVHY